MTATRARYQRVYKYIHDVIIRHLDGKCKGCYSCMYDGAAWAHKAIGEMSDKLQALDEEEGGE